MPLYPIENDAESMETHESYAEIQTTVKVSFTDELNVETIDVLAREIDTQVGMLVSFMLGQLRERLGTELSLGSCDVATRAVLPAADIAEYYRQLADDAESVDEDDDAGIDDVTAEQVRKVMESLDIKPASEVASNPNEGYSSECESYVAKHQAKPDETFVYPCGLREGDFVDFGTDHHVRLPRSAFVTEWTAIIPPGDGQFGCDCGGKQTHLTVHTSHVRRAIRKGIQLQKSNDGRNISFSEAPPTESQSE